MKEDKTTFAKKMTYPMVAFGLLYIFLLWPITALVLKMIGKIASYIGLKKASTAIDNRLEESFSTPPYSDDTL